MPARPFLVSWFPGSLTLFQPRKAVRWQKTAAWTQRCFQDTAALGFSIWPLAAWTAPSHSPHSYGIHLPLWDPSAPRGVLLPPAALACPLSGRISHGSYAVGVNLRSMGTEVSSFWFLLNLQGANGSNPGGCCAL